MRAKNLFILLSVFIIVSTAGFVMAIMSPKMAKIDKLETDLKVTTDKFQNATNAKNDVEHVRGRLKETELELATIKAHFIERKQLREVTEKIKTQTKKYSLSFDEFTPIFKAYSQNQSNGNVKALPFSIAVSGSYIMIGKFLDSWSELPFYMYPDELYLSQGNGRSNVLKANISGRLYVWSKEKQNGN